MFIITIISIKLISKQSWNEPLDTVSAIVSSVKIKTIFKYNFHFLAYCASTPILLHYIIKYKWLSLLIVFIVNLKIFTTFLTSWHIRSIKCLKTVTNANCNCNFSNSKVTSIFLCLINSLKISSFRWYETGNYSRSSQQSWLQGMTLRQFFHKQMLHYKNFLKIVFSLSFQSHRRYSIFHTNVLYIRQAFRIRIHARIQKW